MGDFHYKCVGCDLPVLSKDECASVYVRKGKREMDTLLVGIWGEESKVSYSSVTEEYMTKEELEKRTRYMEEEQEKDYKKYRHSHWKDTEEDAQTGYSVWHLSCLKEELDASEYVVHEKKLLEIDRKAMKEAFETKEENKGMADKLFQERSQKLEEELQSMSPFENRFLEQKFRWHSRWNQNIVSESGQYYFDSLIETVEQKILLFAKMIQEQGTGNEIESEEFAKALVEIGFSEEVLEEALRLKKEQEE